MREANILTVDVFGNTKRNLEHDICWATCVSISGVDNCDSAFKQNLFTFGLRKPFEETPDKTTALRSAFSKAPQ